MQDVSALWHQFTGWLSALIESLRSTDPHEIGREIMQSLWDLSVWLNTGYRGMTIALILLVIIINRILKRQH
jgi:hypothetical protein